MVAFLEVLSEGAIAFLIFLNGGFWKKILETVVYIKVLKITELVVLNLCYLNFKFFKHNCDKVVQKNETVFFFVNIKTLTESIYKQLREKTIIFTKFNDLLKIV